MQEIKVSLLRMKGRDIWYMQYRHPETGRKVKKSSGKTVRRDAERAAAKWEQDLLAGRDNRLGRIAWEEFRQRYEDEALAGLADNTVKKSASVFNAIEEVIRPARLGNITTDAMARLQKHLREKGRSESTIKSYLSHIRAALSWGVGVGLLSAVPKIPKTQRAKSTNVMKGRPITTEELERMIEQIVPALMATMETGKPKAKYKRWSESGRAAYLVKRREQAEALCASWAHLIRGLWWSGLRLTEALDLHWTDDTKLCIDLSCRYPMLRIPAELEKGNKDRLLPIAPEFAEFILQTPENEREGFVFNPAAVRADKQGQRLGEQQVGRLITAAGRLARVKVSSDATTGKAKNASAHDLRRSFGLRWAQRVMPQVLMELMRHESIDTTLRFYVGRNAQATASVLWDAVGKSVGATLGATRQETPTASPQHSPQTGSSKSVR